MDQFASALSKRDHALLIDCRTLAYRACAAAARGGGAGDRDREQRGAAGAVTSAYNERRRECEEAVVRLRELLGRPELSSLRDVSAAEIDGIEIADDDVVLRRARHVVSEIGRVAEAVEALERDDFGRLGELMVESHRSLRDDYEVSSEQLDLLVGLATAQEYVLGARLTGAGFGGCTVNLVRADRVEDFARDVIAVYRERTGLPAVMYVTCGMRWAADVAVVAVWVDCHAERSEASSSAGLALHPAGLADSRAELVSPRDSSLRSE